MIKNLSFYGKRVVVTSGTSGIGLAIASLFIQCGAEVIITGRNKTLVEEKALSLGAGYRI